MSHSSTSFRLYYFYSFSSIYLSPPFFPFFPLFPCSYISCCLLQIKLESEEHGLRSIAKRTLTNGDPGKQHRPRVNNRRYHMLQQFNASLPLSHNNNSCKKFVVNSFDDTKLWQNYSVISMMWCVRYMNQVQVLQNFTWNSRYSVR